MKIIGKKNRIRRTLHKNEMHKESHFMRRSNKKSFVGKWPTGSTDKEIRLPRKDY